MDHIWSYNNPITAYLTIIMEENKKHPSQIIHGFLMADDRKQKEDVPILTHPLSSRHNASEPWVGQSPLTQ